MGITFAWRSDTSTGKAWRHLGDGRASIYRYGVTGAGSSVDYLSASSSAIGDTIFGFGANAVQNLVWPGGDNVPTNTKKISWLCRFAKNAGTATSDSDLFSITGPGKRVAGFGWNLATRTTGKLDLYAYDSGGSVRINKNVLNTAPNYGDREFHDAFFQMRWDTVASSYNFYWDGVLQTTGSFSAWATQYNPVDMATGIVFGICPFWPAGINAYVNEIVIWDDDTIDPTNLTLVTPAGSTSTGQTLDGPSRTGWVDTPQLDGTQWTSITAAQIANGVEQIQAGLTQTGTLVAETWTTITAAEIKSGVQQIQNSQTITGTFTGEVWSTLSASNIREGVEQIQNSQTVTGTLSVPTAIDGTASTINIPQLKEQIRFVLDENNTTTSTVLNLSAGMSKPVKKVMTLNPEVLRPGADVYPALCIYTDSKDVTPSNIARDQLGTRRQAKVLFNIAGMVWNQNFQSNIYDDPADNDLEKLMENTEKILRHYHTLGGEAKWQFPLDVSYHSAAFDENAHFRIAFMSLECTVFY